jgi:hypothetical protein
MNLLFDREKEKRKIGRGKKIIGTEKLRSKNYNKKTSSTQIALV